MGCGTHLKSPIGHTFASTFCAAFFVGLWTLVRLHPSRHVLRLTCVHGSVYSSVYVGMSLFCIRFYHLFILAFFSVELLALAYTGLLPGHTMCLSEAALCLTRQPPLHYILGVHLGCEQTVPSFWGDFQMDWTLQPVYHTCLLAMTTPVPHFLFGGCSCLCSHVCALFTLFAYLMCMSPTEFIINRGSLAQKGRTSLGRHYPSEPTLPLPGYESGAPYTSI